MSRSLLLFSVFYGGMVTIAGVLGAKQVALGPLAVEAGIFPFLLLVGISSGIAELHGKETASTLVKYGFLPLIGAIVLSFFVLQLPTDPGMYPPAKEAFPIILGQSWRMMAAGILAYGTSQMLNVWLFDRLRQSTGQLAWLRAGLGQMARLGYIASSRQPFFAAGQRLASKTPAEEKKKKLFKEIFQMMMMNDCFVKLI